GVLFAKTIFLNQKVFDKIKVPNYIKPAIAGFVIGIVGVFLPYVLGSGNIFISQLFQYKFTLSLIAIIFAVKFLVTPLCFSSGAAGGIFFPVLMLGSFLGYIVGSISNVIGIEINLVTISIVGMGAFLAAVARTPITAIVMVFELTGDYHHILPVMLSIAVADLVAQLFGHEPIYSTLILKQSQNTKEKETLCELKVVDAMDKNVVNVTLKTKISEIPNLMKQTKYNVLPILNDNNVVAGSISKEEIDDYIFSNKNTDDSIENIMNPEPVTINQKENLYKALFVLHTNEILDVIVVDDTNKLAGILCRKQIVFEDRFSDIIV
ncbi:MAG: chloride channel protein, partial [Elusimicrobia bacterium]|nr:chloride channel protein [Elusimicrobiota bacterium]